MHLSFPIKQIIHANNNKVYIVTRDFGTTLQTIYEHIIHIQYNILAYTLTVFHSQLRCLYETLTYTIYKSLPRSFILNILAN